MSSECGQHRRHADGAHICEDLQLQRLLRVDPVLRERALPVVHIAHSIPRKVGGTSEEVGQVRLIEAKLRVH